MLTEGQRAAAQRVFDLMVEGRAEAVQAFASLVEAVDPGCSLYEGLDPSRLFVSSAISRAGVAEDFNEALFGGADQMQPGWAFGTGDRRLTDDLCQHYADSLGVMVGDEEELDRLKEELIWDILEEMGHPAAVNAIP